MLFRSVANEVPVPVIASGGMGKPQDLLAVIKDGKADAVAMADILHYGRFHIQDVRSAAILSGIKVRAHANG